jgi:hypothetical protein
VADPRHNYIFILSDTDYNGWQVLKVNGHERVNFLE